MNATPKDDNAMRDPVQAVVDRLEAVKQTGLNQWQARCPAHDDRKPSLSISRGSEGQALIHCHAGCKPAAVLEAIGMKESDMFPASESPTGAPSAERRMVAEYDYRDEHGKVLHRVVRFDPKAFRQCRPDGSGGWIWNLDGVPRVLYRLPELLAAEKDAWIFVCEGEKDADNVAAIGLVATTNPGGAGKWKHLADDSALHERRVAIIPDIDEPGRKHAQDVASRLHGKAADVKILDLGNAEGFQGNDVSDWIDSLDSKESEDLARSLVEMAEAAPEWTSMHENPYAPVPVLKCLADVKAEPVRWLWRERIALGKLTLLAGDPGIGKSLITLDLAARVSSGSDMPDGSSALDCAGDVVLLTAEDDLVDTVRPRLDAAGAEVLRITALESVKRYDFATGKEHQAPFSLTEDLPALDKAIRSARQCRLVVIDPLTAYLGGTDSYKNAEVRGLLAPLAELAAQHKVAVVGVTHLRKSEGPAMYRPMGSLAFVAAARAVYMVTQDPDSARGERCLVLPVKNNLGNNRTGLAYRLVVTQGRTVPVVQWEPEPVDVSVEEALGCDPGEGDVGWTQRDEAREWLKQALHDGPLPAREAIRQAEKDGIRKRTLDRGRRELGVAARREGFGGEGRWMWELHTVSRDVMQRPTPKKVATFGESGDLWADRGPEADSARHRGCQSVKDCQQKGSAEAGAGHIGEAGHGLTREELSESS